MKSFVIFAALLCYAQASSLPQLKAKAPTPIGTLELDTVRTEEWVRKFYDNCGRTWSTDEGWGTHGKETVKRCVGDSDGCIENQNCVFAVAVSENAEYIRSYATTPPTTTTPAPNPPPFTDWKRLTRSVEITLLDTCHLYPLPNGMQKTDKFVGVAFGIFNDAGYLESTEGPDPENGWPTQPEPYRSFERRFNFNNIRAYFAVKNYTECDIMPDTPVHPYIQIDGSLTSDPIQNTITMDHDTWNAMYGKIQDTVGSTTFTTNPTTTPNSVYMKHLLIHHYGTPKFTDLTTELTFMDSEYEQREIVFISPKNRTIEKPPPQDNKGSSLYISSLISLAVVIPFFSKLF